MVEIIELEKMVDDGLTLTQISKQIGISLSSVKRHMAKNGIKSKSYSIKSEIIKCVNCDKEFKVLKCEERKFCSCSCSSVYNNKLREKKVKIEKVRKKRVRLFKEINYGICVFCGTDIIKKDGRSKAKYCDQICLHNHQMMIRIQSEKASTRTLKLYLIKNYGEKCMECGWDKRNIVTDKVPVELEHVDGNSENNNLDNLKLLCPNCHSLTSTYKALNRGNGRHKRRERYNEGKSY